MTNDIIKKALEKKGQFASLSWESPAKVKKPYCNEGIMKKVYAHTVKIGVAYNNLKSTKEGRLNGSLPEVNAGLNGLKWVKYPVLLENPKTGEQFISIKLNKKSKFKSEYTAEVTDKLLSSGKSKTPATTINVNVKYIKTIS